MIDHEGNDPHPRGAPHTAGCPCIACGVKRRLIARRQENNPRRAHRATQRRLAEARSAQADTELARLGWLKRFDQQVLSDDDLDFIGRL